MSVFLVKPSSDGEVEVKTTKEYPHALNQFWPKAIEEIGKTGPLDIQKQAFPLARIKKVMRLDDSVNLISAEAPMLFSKAAELFIKELTHLAWIHAEDYRRKTLQRNNIAMAITKYDQFDFLLDIVPREKAQIVTKTVKTSLNNEQVQNYFKRQQQQQTNNASGSSAGQTIQILQPVNNQVVSLRNGTQDQVNIENISNNTSNITSTSTTGTGSQPQIIQLQGNIQALNTNSNSVLQFVKQVIIPTGEIQQVPIQINSHQLQMLCMPIQNSPQSQQVQVVQSQPQIIQVASQANGRTPVNISQQTIKPSSSPE